MKRPAREPRSGHRRAARLATAFALASLAVPTFASSPAFGEDPCPPDAPGHASAVQGHTWTGAVTIAAPTGASNLGVEDWLITFDVDHVYADREDPDLPTAPIVAGRPFDLPSNTCGRGGDMGLEVGGRYLVSTSSFGDGTAIGSIVAWKLEGDHVTLVSMYKTPALDPEFGAAKTLEDALALVTTGVSPSESPVASPIAEPTHSGPDSGTAPVVVGAMAAIGAAVLGVLAWRLRRSRSA